MPRVCSFILFLLLSFRLLGQDPAFITLGKSELANKDIYSILETKSNRLLLATNYGLYEYTQNGVVKLAESDSQIGKSQFNLKEDAKGNIFCCNLNGQIFELRANKLALYYQIPDSLLAGQIIFEFDEHNNIIIGTKYLLRLNEAKEIKLIKTSDKPASISYLFKENNKIFFSNSSNRNVYSYNNGKVSEVTHRENPTDKSGSARHFWMNGQIYSINQNSTYDRGNITNIPFKLEDRESYIYSKYNPYTILATSRSRGAFLIEINGESDLKLKPKFFKKFSLSSHFVNNNGTHYFGTFGQGLIMVLTDELRSKQFDQYKHLLKGLCSIKDTIYITTSQGQVLRLDEQYRYTIVDQVPNTLAKIFPVNSDLKSLGLSNTNLLYDIPQLSGERNPMGNIKGICETKGSRILIASSNGLYCISKDTLFEDNWKALSNKGLYRCVLTEGRVNGVAYDERDSAIFLSKSTGVFMIKGNVLNQVRDNGKAIYGASIVYKKGVLYVATQNRGVLLLREGKVEDVLNTTNGLRSNQVYKLKIRGHNLYIGHDKGLQVFSLKNNEIKKTQGLEKLISYAVNDFDFSGNNIVLLNNNAVYEIPIGRKLIKVPDLSFELDSVWVNQKFSKKRKLSYNENNLRLKLKVNNVEHFHSAEFSYRLKGFENKWNKDNLKNLKYIQYRHLPPGKYTLQVRNISDTSSGQELSYSFEILRPYWNTWWFISLVSFLSALCISLVYIVQVKKIRKKNEKELLLERSKSELLEAKLRTLRAQMNPHFIFNSLNSIQDLILKGESDLSYDYLVKFSDLVRKALKYSEKDIIKVSEEIDFLNVYLELEKLRFEDDFEFIIHNTLKSDVKIPSMIIQPIVENALVHGLKHKEGKRRLEIEFIEGENVLCFIRDNGIGREKAKEYSRNTEKHLSFATNSIKKRLEYYAKPFDKETGMSYNDLLENGQAAGTEVKMVLPKL